IWGGLALHERALLYAVAQLGTVSKKGDEVADFLVKEHIRVSGIDILTGFSNLEKQDFLCETAGNYSSSMELFRRWICDNKGLSELRREQNQASGVTVRQLAQASYSQGELRKAEGLVRMALDDNPKDSEALVLLSCILRDDGRPAEAVESAEQAY